MSILTKGESRTCASLITARCKQDAKEHPESEGLSDAAIADVRGYAEDTFTRHSTNFQSLGAHAQQNKIVEKRNKINSHLRDEGLRATSIVDQVARGKQKQAAEAQALYQQQVPVSAPDDLVAAAAAQYPGSQAAALQPPAVPAEFQDGPVFPPQANSPQGGLDTLS